MELAGTSAAMIATAEFVSAAAALVFALTGLAHAESSAWSEDLRSEIRLISGDTTATPMHAGVEMKLQKGWHTYWRYPGDSGVPPQFDFAKSVILTNARVFFIAPHS